MSLISFKFENDEFVCANEGKQYIEKATINEFAKNIKKLYELKKEINKSDDPDSYLDAYNNKIDGNKNKNKYWLSVQDAKKKLLSFHSDEYSKLIAALKNFKHDILIAGSSVLASVCSSNCFEPNDVDLYIKNVDYKRILDFDEFIKTTYSDNQILLIRRPLTITWMILENNQIKMKLQLNTTVFKSWSNVFISYHCDFVCIGYDVLNDKIITLKNRWNNFINNYNKISTLCTNVNSIDNDQTLVSSSKKYMNRGFMTIPVYIKGLNACFVKKNKNGKSNGNSDGNSDGNDVNDYTIDMSGDDDSTKKNDNNEEKTIVSELVKTYSGLIDVIFTNDISKIVDEKLEFPKLEELCNISPIDDYIVSIINYESFDETVCPITLDSYCVGVKNINCSHIISLKALMFDDLEKCPICREKYLPKLCFTKKN